MLHLILNMINILNVFVLLPGNLWIIIVSVGSAALLIVIVAVMIWKKSKGESVRRLNCYKQDV